MEQLVARSRLQPPRRRAACRSRSCAPEPRVNRQRFKDRDDNGTGGNDKRTVDPRRYFESVEADSDVPEHEPVCLYLETTNRCNLLCTTCPRTYEELEPPADMSWELFTSIVDQIPRLHRAVLHGVGEPMLVKNLPRMVRYLKDRGTYVLFNTNGTVLNEKNGRALIAAELDELRVSFDAANAEILSRHPRQELFQPHPEKRARVPRAAGARGSCQAARLGLADGLARNHRGIAGLRARRRGDRHQGSPSAAAGVLQGQRHRHGAAGPGALRAALRRGGGPYRSRRRAGQIARHHVQRVGRRLRAGHEPQAHATTARRGRCAAGRGR